MRTRKPATVVTVLEAAGVVGVVPHIWGKPGIGKTAVVTALAETLGLRCETVLGSQCDPTDIGGTPIVPEGERAHLLSPPPWARRLSEDGAGVLFFDELPNAPQQTQAAMLSVLFGGAVGELVLPRAVRIVAAGNPPEFSVDGQDLTPPVSNRLLHLDYDPDPEEWFAGMLSGFAAPAASRALPRDADRLAASRAAVVAFLNTRSDLVHKLPDSREQQGRAWPSQRTWAMCADILAVIPDEDADARAVATAGLVGDGAAAEFAQWQQHHDLPRPRAVLDDPESVDWAALDPSQTYAVIAGLVALVTALGTQDAWREAWVPLGVAAERGKADVAAWGAYRLGDARPANTAIPKAAKRFAPVAERMNEARRAETAAQAAAKAAAAADGATGSTDGDTTGAGEQGRDGGEGSAA